MSLLLIKYLRQGLANAERELSRHIDGARLTAYKEMKRVNKLILTQACIVGNHTQ
jgi:hypothetical protein